MKQFIARYKDKGVDRTICFDKNSFTKEQAEELLTKNNIQNFFFFFEPNSPVDIDENTTLFNGEIGWDITSEMLMPYLKEGKTIIINSVGGSMYEGLLIHDMIKLYGQNTTIGVMGICASAATYIPIAAVNSWASENSRFLIHAPSTWAVGNASDLKIEVERLEYEENRLVNLYVNASGKSEDEIRQLMYPERFFDAMKAKELNFVKEIKGEISNPNNKQMDVKQVEEKLGFIENLLNKVLNILPKSPKNIILQTSDGQELDFGTITSEDEIIPGVTATVGGSPASGSYVLPDGRTLVFENGTLTEIITSDNEEIENLKREKAELENKIKELENSLIEKDTQLRDAGKDLDQLRNEVHSLKNVFSNHKPNLPNNVSDPEPTKPKQKFTYNKKP